MEQPESAYNLGLLHAKKRSQSETSNII